ncbi:hypothetical protein [Ectothiorhodospira mobilis]|uniref:hypothetical protein n=1 Tax=Ectothiorhodospira mobilis TaxID=195064 RepID=UPI001904C0C7|nr:hypothetical protein [Ectothiorhodospira mobilis]MBK1691108.1 hypothetical protein [Ectothiorhodospira mobilis]
MAIDTIDAAMADMGRQLNQKKIVDAIRQTLAAGGTYEVVLSVVQEKNGATVTMQSRSVTGRTTLGRLIRLR